MIVPRKIVLPEATLLFKKVRRETGSRETASSIISALFLNPCRGHRQALTRVLSVGVRPSHFEDVFPSRESSPASQSAIYLPELPSDRGKRKPGVMLQASYSTVQYEMWHFVRITEYEGGMMVRVCLMSVLSKEHSSSTARLLGLRDNQTGNLSLISSNRGGGGEL
jgi:hypothetical protein